MHYDQTRGCKDKSVCIEIKEPYKSLFELNGDRVLEKYPVRYSFILKFLPFLFLRITWFEKKLEYALIRIFMHTLMSKVISKFFFF